MISYFGMLFRIEDVDGLQPNLRSYDSTRFKTYSVEKDEIDICIARLIASEVNGAKDRVLHSYSKSLAACLLKYNKYTDNELHIFIDNGWFYDRLFYQNCKGDIKSRDYSIEDRIMGYWLGYGLFNKAGSVDIKNFVVDVSNNAMLNEYLKIYTGKGLKSRVSPEKDNEVVVLNPPSDISIRNYIGAVYVIYALQMKYQFTSDSAIRDGLIRDIYLLDDFRFQYGPQEREAIVHIVLYLSYKWQYEKIISAEMYKYSKKQEHLSLYYDSILQYWGIQESTFAENYNMISYYQSDVVTELALKWCCEFLNKV